LTIYTDKSTYRKLRNKLITLAALSVGFLAYALSAARPDLVERSYSRGVYPYIANVWGGLTSAFSFSAAEFIVYALALAVIFRIVRAIAWIIGAKNASGRVYYLLDLIVSGAVFFATLGLLFIALWGFNYNRLPFADTSGLKVASTSVAVLEKSSVLFAEQANEFRKDVRENDEGVMTPSVPLRNTLSRAKDGLKAAAAEFETLAGIEPCRPKPVLASKLLSYAGITGVYFPLTAEANVNTDITGPETPFTICHEMSHHLGFAREDEANFISWIACSNSPYEDFKYSGSLMALLNLLNALSKRDAAAWGRVRAMCSPEVNRDLNAMGQYWQKYEGPVSEISETINDTFLKANRQEDGVQSYGRMVDLVIAYLAANGIS